MPRPYRSPTRIRCAQIIALLSWLCVCNLPNVAFAQGPATEPAASDPPAIVAPKPAGSTDVLYPDQGQGESVVLLHLLVTEDGTVRDATAVSGEEPFTTVAREAALTWRFTPATRNGVPVAARIRFEVRFVPPAPIQQEELAEPPETTPPVAPPASVSVQPSRPPAKRSPVTVFVHGEKPAPAVRTLTRAEVRQLPGAFGDPFRAIEVMPGVTPMVSGVPFFFVRGAPPGNVGYYLDGIRVPLLYHVALGPSVIHPAIVSRVDLYPGGYPAQFGRFTGGIVAAETTEPALALRGEGNVRVVDAGAFVEDAWSDGLTTASAGGRYSYTAAALSLLSPDVVLQYWDYQLRVARKLNARDSVGVFSFGAYDYLGEKRPEGKIETLLGTQFHRLDLRYDRRPSDDEHLRLAVMVGWDQTDGEEDGLFLRDRLVGARLEWKRRDPSGVWWRAGSDITMDTYDVLLEDEQAWEGEPEEDPFEQLFPTRKDVAVGAYVSAVIPAAPGITVTPGVRADVYQSDGATALGVDPRLSAEFALSERVRWEHTVGLVHQPPAFAVPIPGFQIGGLQGGLQRALQSSSGVHVELPEDVSASVTAFQSVFLNMSDAIGMARGTYGEDIEDNWNARSIGRSFGVEVYLRRRLTHRLGGFLSYTLSRSTRSFGRVRIPSSFDRTHVFNVAAAYDLGRAWRAGTRFTYYSGFPGDLTYQAFVVGRSAQRSPGFYRADVRIEKRWRINEAGAWWALVFEVLNATLRKEVVEYECDIGGCRAEEVGPVTIPSIGVEVAF